MAIITTESWELKPYMCICVRVCVCVCVCCFLMNRSCDRPTGHVPFYLRVTGNALFVLQPRVLLLQTVWWRPWYLWLCTAYYCYYYFFLEQKLYSHNHHTDAQYWNPRTPHSCCCSSAPPPQIYNTKLSSAINQTTTSIKPWPAPPRPVFPSSQPENSFCSHLFSAAVALISPDFLLRRRRLTKRLRFNTELVSVTRLQPLSLTPVVLYFLKV